MQEILRLTQLNKSYNKHGHCIKAVKDVSLEIYSGEFFGLIGESGCGKSTIARLVSGLDSAYTGAILINGQKLSPSSVRSLYNSVQMIFQTPQDSFNPRLTLGASIAEGLANRGYSRAQAYEQVAQYLERCGLNKVFIERYPHQVSGGECQRAAIARALILQPQLLICDEPTSALDVSTQAQIMELLYKLKQEQQLACLFISHDIALSQQICDRIAVMQDGRIVELDSTTNIINRPQTEYTATLIHLALGNLPDIDCDSDSRADIKK